MTLREMQEYRPVGTRNFIRVRDTVKVKPSRPGKKDGFLAVVRKIKGRDGRVCEVEVSPLTGKHIGSVRTFVPDRIERVAQTRNGRTVEVRR